MKKQVKTKLAEIQAQQDIATFSADLSRARSVTVGTSFGGTTEVSMRAPNGQSLWCAMQPVEVIELIHQLAANVGCHIHLQPRNDFSSWRQWQLTENEKLHLGSHPPFVNDMAPFAQIGAVKDPIQTVLRPNTEGFQGVGGGFGGAGGDYINPLGENGGNAGETTPPQKRKLLDKGEKNVVATKKTVNGRNTKRASKAS